MGLFPSSIEQQQPGAPNPAGPGLAEKWRGWLKSPGNASLLMQAGIAMLQPMQLGQSTAGAISSAVGQGFQARDRTRAYAAETAQTGVKNAQNERELNLREREGAAKEEYYKNVGGRGGVSASAIFRDNQSDAARKQKAWMEFVLLARDPLSGGDPDTPIEELKAAFEETYSVYEAENSAAPAALPGLETPAGGPLEEARAAIAKGANREAVIKRLKENGIDATGL